MFSEPICPSIYAQATQLPVHCSPYKHIAWIVEAKCSRSLLPSSAKYGGLWNRYCQKLTVTEVGGVGIKRHGV